MFEQLNNKKVSRRLFDGQSDDRFNDRWDSGNQNVIDEAPKAIKSAVDSTIDIAIVLGFAIAAVLAAPVYPIAAIAAATMAMTLFIITRTDDSEGSLLSKSHAWITAIGATIGIVGLAVASPLLIGAGGALAVLGYFMSESGFSVKTLILLALALAGVVIYNDLL